MKKVHNKDVKYSVYCYRLDKKTSKRLKRNQSKERVSWNIFFNRLCDIFEDKP